MNVFGIIVLIIVLYLLYRVMYYMMSNPYVIQGTQNAETASTISATSLQTSGSNSSSTSNFAYSIWFYINDWNYRYGEPKVIFGRMGNTSDASGNTDASGNATSTVTSIPGVSGLDPCPAVVLGAIENNLMVALGCYPGATTAPTSGGKSVVHTCSVSNIPIQSWVNLTMSVYGRTMDLYIDGKLVRTCLLPGIAKVNNNSNIYVTPKGGFDGWTSNFQYFPNALNPQQAWTIYTKGYGGGSMTGSSYTVQVSLLKNGTSQSSFTI